LRYGTTLILESAFDPERTTELLRREQVTLAGSGTVFTQIFLEQQRRGPAHRLLPNVRAYTTGAAPKPATLHVDVKAELGGVGVLSGYGMTEAPILAMAGPGDPDVALATAEGRLCEGVSVRVVAPDGRVCGPGEPGELRFKGPQVLTGYIDPNLDRDAFDGDGWLRSGDLGSVDEDGNLTVTGRLKDVIIRKGETISARAIEDDLLDHPAVAEVAVVGLPHETYGEIACAVVVRNGPEPLTLTDLTAALDARGLPKRQWPERLVLRDELPRSSTGKILKSDLRADIVTD
jgi:acyl-CoA synthetase (AMP-forming)/AMP-acid ligase II